MQEPCTFYKVKVTTLQRKTTSPNRNSEHPHIYRIGYCAHPKSKPKFLACKENNLLIQKLFLEK